MASSEPDVDDPQVGVDTRDANDFPYRHYVADNMDTPAANIIKQALVVFAKSRLPAFIGLLDQAQTNRLAVGARDHVTCFEASKVDRLLYVGPHGQALEGRSEHEKLRWLEAEHRHRRLNPAHIVLIDDKSGRNKLIRRRGTWELLHGNMAVSQFQRENASFLFLTFAGAPDIAALVPTALALVMHTDRVPSPIPFFIACFAFKREKTAEALQNLADALRDDTFYHVPDSTAKFRPSRFKIEIDRNTLSMLFQHTGPTEPAARRGFNVLYEGSKASSSGFSIHMADHPWAGDALLRKDQDKSDWLLEIKYGLLTEDDDHVYISSPALYSTSRRGSDEHKLWFHRFRSVFHPIRVWHLGIFFDQHGQFGYCIPCSEIDPSWYGDFKDTNSVEIDRRLIAHFRFTTTSSDWFSSIVDIAKKYWNPVRPGALLDQSSPDDIKRYVVYAIAGDGKDDEGEIEELVEEVEDDDEKYREYDTSDDHAAAADDDDDDQPGVSTGPLRKASKEPHWKAERLNIQARKHGFGMCLSLSIGRKKPVDLPSNTFIPRVWSKEDNNMWDLNARKLSLDFHPGFIAPPLPHLVLRCIPNVERKFRTYPGHGFRVNAVSHLIKPRHPTLFAIDTMSRADCDFIGSTLLIPSECIDWEKVEKYTSTTIGGTDIKIEDYIFDRLLWEFLVRDNEELYKAIVDFMFAHAHAGDDERKLVSWYKYRGRYWVNGKMRKSKPLYVTGDYVWSTSRLYKAGMAAALRAV